MEGKRPETAMRWVVKHGDILDEPADVLVCSANPWLNLSGGVGGEILLRYGPQMQAELHRHLTARGLRSVPQGEVVPCGPCDTPYRAVLHAVAVDCFYGSSPRVVEAVVTRALSLAASLGAAKVALTALATGYGRMPILDFARGLAPVLGQEFPPVAEVAVCLRGRNDAEELAAALATAPPPRPGGA
jgi:O-acetyl-ADP-ribose deacetylase (regulator of RNase III)